MAELTEWQWTRKQLKIIDENKDILQKGKTSMARIMARGREARGKKPGLESNRRGNDVDNIVARLSVIMRQNV